MHPPNNDFEREILQRMTAMESTRADIVRRISEIEGTHPHTVAEKIGEIAGEVRSLKHSFYTLGFSVMGGAILFALGQIFR